MDKGLWIGSDGDLMDKACKVVRPRFSRHHSRMIKAREVAATLRAGEWAWPGGYPLYFITRDGAALCFKCVRKEWRRIVWDFVNDASTGWRVEGSDVNYEDTGLVCAHCGKGIESAYGTPDLRDVVQAV